MMWWMMFGSLYANPLDAHLLYFILVDRFSNGNPNNDVAVDRQDLQAFHGGDLEGVEQKLSYIRDLGADALWLSPVFNMRTQKFHEHGAFHGYWIQNLDAIEPAFGGEKALTSLTEQSKSQGVQLIMDMVYNHVSFDSPMLSTHADWFHEDKTIENWDDPFERTHHQVHGLPDLDQSNPEVYNYLLKQSLFWKQKAELSGFRIDAIRHMENEFLSKLSNDINQEESNTWLLGEDFQGNPVELIDRANATSLDALFDFPNYYAMNDLFCKGLSHGAFAANLWLDRQYPIDFQFVTFLDNHDLPRLHSSCTKENAMQALFTQFSIRGLPMITYGTELGLKGAKEPENRADMPWNATHPAQELITTLTTLRKNNPVLESGKGFVEHFDQDSLVYTQFLNGASASLAINRSNTPMTYPHPLNQCYFVNRQGIFSLCSSNIIEPNSTRLWLDTRTPKEKKSIRSEITVSPCSPQQDIRVVGSTPNLGGWNPHKGLRLVERNGTCHASILVDQYAALRFKVVEVQEKKIQWEKGPDHILWNNDHIDISWTP